MTDSDPRRWHSRVVVFVPALVMKRAPTIRATTGSVVPRLSALRSFVRQTERVRTIAAL